jgi:hypothetical protein
MMKSVHQVIDFTEVAHRRYWRDNGEQAPMPASGYEAAEHDGKSFVVVSNIDGPLATYRIDFGERDWLRLLGDAEPRHMPPCTRRGRRPRAPCSSSVNFASPAAAGGLKVSLSTRLQHFMGNISWAGRNGLSKPS